MSTPKTNGMNPIKFGMKLVLGMSLLYNFFSNRLITVPTKRTKKELIIGLETPEAFS